MFLLSEVLTVSELVSNAIRSVRRNGASCALAAAMASMMLVSPVSAHAQTPDSASVTAEQIHVEDQVDINTADAETLALALDGVGMAKARDIIAYREQNGEFKSADDLQKVRGIGKATLERNRSRILVVPSED